MKQVVNTNLSDRARTALREAENKGSLIESAIKSLSAKCPHCKKPWPTEAIEKHKVSVRIDEKLAEQLSKYANVSKLIAASLNDQLGLCPVCERPKK